MYRIKQAAILAYENLVKNYSRMDTSILPTLWDYGITIPNQ